MTTAVPPTAASLGEFGLIARVTGRLRAPAPPYGPGDDAAVVAAPDGWVLASTDLLVEGVHFRFGWSSAYDVGRKAAAQNLADVMAMGGRATALLVGLAAPGDLTAVTADGLADGLRDEAELVGARVVGGDMVRSAGALTIAVTVLGDLAGRAPVTRSGAREGDQIVLAGQVGRSAAGLALLRRGESGGPLVEAHRRPQPPYPAGPELALLGATAMIDVSDGLAADAGHLASASRVRLDLVSSSLLAEPGVTTDDRLYGGEDHALLATLPVGVRSPYPVIGRVTAGAGVWVDGVLVSGGGWDHFA